MDWMEAKKAFAAQVPVVYHPMGGGPIVCTRLAEIGLRCTRDGKVIQVCGGMDRNENCIYHAAPENFTLAEGVAL